jgi:hypothetical protein
LEISIKVDQEDS